MRYVEAQGANRPLLARLRSNAMDP
jgi:hypothetical protein